MINPMLEQIKIVVIRENYCQDSVPQGRDFQEAV